MSGRMAIQVQRASLQHILGRHVAVGAIHHDDTSILSHCLQVVERSEKRD
jgi:hypothetical protein